VSVVCLVHNLTPGKGYRDNALRTVIFFVCVLAFDLDPNLALEAVNNPFLKLKQFRFHKMVCSSFVGWGHTMTTQTMLTIACKMSEMLTLMHQLQTVCKLSNPLSFPPARAFLTRTLCMQPSQKMTPQILQWCLHKNIPKEALHWLQTYTSKNEPIIVCTSIISAVPICCQYFWGFVRFPQWTLQCQLFQGVNFVKREKVAHDSAATMGTSPGRTGCLDEIMT